MKVGQLVRIEAEPEYADEVAATLRSAHELAEREQGTVKWFAFRENATTLGAIDTGLVIGTDRSPSRHN